MPQKRVAPQVTATAVSPNGHHPASTETALPEAEAESVIIDAGEPPAPQGKPLSRFEEYILDDEAEALGEEMLLTACPARQPRDSDLFRVRPDHGSEVWHIKTLIVEYRGEDPAVPRGFYLIHPRLARIFSGLGKAHILFTCVTTFGSMFIWPIRLVEGFGDSWSKSKLRIAAQAESQWVRVPGSQSNGYVAVVSRKDHGEPKWQGTTLDELLAIAFDGRHLPSRDRAALTRPLHRPGT